MLRVLQQHRINGKACLVEDGELDTLLDVLNLSSEEVDEQREADLMSDRIDESYLEHEHLPEDAENTEVMFELTGAVDEEAGILNETTASEEVADIQEEAAPEPAEFELKDDEEPEAELDDTERVVAWYYWPNGLMTKQ